VSPLTVIGGPVMSRHGFVMFGEEWAKMLHAYRIPNPLHMNDFVRPNGKHIAMPIGMKIALFRDAVAIINKHKLYSLSIGVPHDDFRSLLSEDVCRQLIGPYAFTFFSMVLGNQLFSKKITKDIGHLETIAYLVDHGCAFPEQLLAAHSKVQEREGYRGERNTAAMAFDTDDNVPQLQAADVIAWSARRNAVNKLSNEFEPLRDVLQEKIQTSDGRDTFHKHLPLSREAIEMWALRINNWLALTGEVPTFDDFLR
jgi:hypothetical protein